IGLGGLNSAGGEMTNNGVARWDGAAWHAIGPSPTSYASFSLTAWDPDGAGPQGPELVVGFFDSTINRPVIAAWNGSAWQPFAPVNYVNGVPTSLGTMPSGPYAGQLIAGMTGDNGVFRWDGAAWQQLVPPRNCICTYDPLA